MEQNESVHSMYTRFTDIVNTLRALGKTFSNSEKVKKIIRSLPKEWRQKRTAIEEAKNLNILPIDNLIGSLISYEEDLAAERGNEERKKTIALKVTKYESDEESEPDDEELAMLARRFKKIFKKTGDRRKFRNFKNQKEKKEVIICYECKKPGHIRSECPLLNKLKKKAMVATWDDSDEDSSDEDESQEVSNLAVMALGDDDDLNEVSDPTYDELYDAFKKMHDELMKIDGELQEESSKEIQEHAPQENQEDRQEEQTNMELEQQEDHHLETHVSMMGELKYFLGLQIKQNNEGIFINQAKYVKDLLKRFGIDESNTKNTPMSTTIKLDKDEKDKEVDIKKYRDADFPGHKVDRKSTSGTCHFLGHSLVSWFSKKQNSVALSTTEAEYIAAAGNQLECSWTATRQLATCSKRLAAWKLSPTREQAASRLGHSNMENLEICDKSLKYLLIAMGWKNVLVVNDPYYENLVKVFYLNMDTELSNRIVTNVGRVHIEFDVALLNSILGTPNEGLEIYSARAKIKQPWFSLENAVRKICRRRDLSTAFCNSPLKSQALPLQTRILHYVLHHVITPRAGHADEVSRLDVAILDCILEERVLNIGYIILHHMLSTPNLAKRSLPYASIITRILEYFRVPITEPISLNSRELGDESIANLGYYWSDDQWRKDNRNKMVGDIAPRDHRFFKDVRLPHLFPDLSAPYLSHPPPSEGPSHSTSAASKDPLQQLLTKVDSLSERQDKLQSMLEAFQLQSISERERLFAQQQQLLDGQHQLFAALGFPPPSSSLHPPSP
ncbi:hypothetical protein KPL70_011393 [Citrus sinensis]|nr:hypothetical protein KPL70_011393 [Citrus sinensis]